MAGAAEEGASCGALPVTRAAGETASDAAMRMSTACRGGIVSTTRRPALGGAKLGVACGGVMIDCWVQHPAGRCSQTNYEYYTIQMVNQCV